MRRKNKNLREYSLLLESIYFGSAGPYEFEREHSYYKWERRNLPRMNMCRILK
jgi:hypothetical protein